LFWYARGVGWIVQCEHGAVEPILANASFGSSTNFGIPKGWTNYTTRELPILVRQSLEHGGQMAISLMPKVGGIQGIKT